jgi:predicted amidohydrolase
MRAAAVQLNSTDEYDRNLEVAEQLVRAAAAEGAQLVVLPEKWTLVGPAEALRSSAEPLDGPANTSVLFGPDGERLALYRKIHMFDVDVGDVSYRESETEQPGDEIVVGEAGGVLLGLTICYDLRFPELYRILALRGARVITVPSAFTERTGRDHWEVLIRARAIEDQVFMVAAGQIGFAPPHYQSYGRSMIVDPWGVVIAQAADTECFVAAELDFTIQEEMRGSLPSLRNRRPETYSWPDRGGANGATAPEVEPATSTGAAQ